MKKEEIDQYRKNLLLEHEHFLRMLYISILKDGVWDDPMYSIKVGGFVMAATDKSLAVAYSVGDKRKWFVKVAWDDQWNIKREESHIVPGKWMEKAQAFINNALAEDKTISDNLISKMLHKDPEIEKIELEA